MKGLQLGPFARCHAGTRMSQSLFAHSVIRNISRDWRQRSGRCQSLPDSADNRRRAEDYDPHYRRVDLSTQHAYEARRGFLLNVARGEAGIDLADAALHVAAEDDALVSHSSVSLPVAAFHKRLERLADEVSQLRLKPLLERGASSEELLAAVQDYIFRDKGFRATSFGRSNLPGSALVDSPGVWEDARNAYLNEVLIRRQGIPAVLMIVVSDVMRRLLQKGVIDFAARVDVSDLGTAPRSEIMPGLGRRAVIASDGSVLNTCSSEALMEVLRYLKRAYWPFPWDAKLGGFIGAAEAALSGQQGNAELEAIARTAQHRLERGIWTSPGAGDLRRAVAAAERLVILCGERYPKERRDLAILYLHCGRVAEARVELAHFADRAAQEQEKAPLWQSLQEQILVDRLEQLLLGCSHSERTISDTAAGSAAGTAGSAAAAGSAASAGGSSGAGGGVSTQAATQIELLTLESAMRQPPPVVDDDKRKLPLTW